jgi:hypothetical protein
VAWFDCGKNPVIQSLYDELSGAKDFSSPIFKSSGKLLSSWHYTVKNLLFQYKIKGTVKKFEISSGLSPDQGL